MTEQPGHSTEEGVDADEQDFSYMWNGIEDTVQVDLLQKLSTKDRAFFRSLASQSTLRPHLLGIFNDTFGVMGDTAIELLSDFDIERMESALIILHASKLDTTYLEEKVRLLKSLSTRSKSDRLDTLFYSEEKLLRKKEEIETQKVALEARISALMKEIQELEQPMRTLDRQLGAIAAERRQLLGDVKESLGKEFDEVVGTSLGEFLR